MSIDRGIIGLGILSTTLPIVGVVLRGKSRFTVVSTVLVAVAVSAYLAILYRVVDSGGSALSIEWVQALVTSPILILLTGYLFAVGFGREQPGQSFHDSRQIFGLLAILGVVLLLLRRHEAFITGYEWAGGQGTIHLGVIGKAYVSYLLLGVVSVGYNLEKTYRIATNGTGYRMRIPLLGMFSLLGFFTFVLATGALYSSIGIGKLAASGLPVTFACALVGHGFIRGGMEDVTAPVSRNVIYSSFTAVAAGLFVFSVGITAQVASVTNWSPGEVLVVSVGFLSILMSTLFLFSNRFKRKLRRFIDRNFYVNRYDYRTQWSKISESVKGATNRDELLEYVAAALGDVFLADHVTIAIDEEATHELRPAIGKGQGNPSAVMGSDTPLVNRLTLGKKSLLLNRKTDDFSYIPIYAENDNWLNETASQIIAPMLDSGRLLGTLGLERQEKDDSFTYEDAALLDSIAGHVSASLRSMQLAQEVVESREIELMSQWSSMLLHDMKNHLAPLRMVASNLIECRDNPEAAAICAGDIGRVADRMEVLMRTLGELREHYELGMHPVSLNLIIERILDDMQLSRRASVDLDVRLQAENSVRGDEKMLRRVMENLITNAVEAMEGEGKLSICTRDQKDTEIPLVQARVSDTGCGMSDEFIREKLFRPFETTKTKGLGLGLYQCRLIVRAHGGDLTVTSRPGSGTMFQTLLAAAS